VDFTDLPIGEQLCAGIEATNASGTTLIQYSLGFSPIPAAEIPPPGNVNADAVPAPTAARCFAKKSFSASKISKNRKYSMTGKTSKSGEELTLTISGPKSVSYWLGGTKLKSASKSPWAVTIPASRIESHGWLYAYVDTGKARIRLQTRLVTTTC
jgi:hypothetical protein